MLKTSIQLHKWIGLVVGIQILFWVLGGLVMTAIPIETVHGDQHIGPGAPKAAIAPDGVKSFAEIAKLADFPVGKAELRGTPNGPVWIVDSTSGQQKWLDAKTGGEVQEVSEAQARAAAVQGYAGKGVPTSAKLLDESVEAGVGGPLWQVRFNDGEGTTLYVDGFNGDVVSRRSDIWRFYDFFFRLHIMNFGPAETYNHPLIIAASAVSLAVVLTGFILLWFRVGRDVKGWLARRKDAQAAR
jgi:uncharacterized iron-regulated membrane protein